MFFLSLRQLCYISTFDKPLSTSFFNFFKVFLKRECLKRISQKSFTCQYSIRLILSRFFKIFFLHLNIVFVFSQSTIFSHKVYEGGEKIMTVFRCENRYDCTGFAFVVSLIVGIIAAFLQITGVITLAPIFSIVAFGIAIVYLAVVLLATALSGICRTINEICQKNGCNTGYNFCSNKISYILTAKCHGECKMTAKQCRTRYNKSSI